MYKIDTYYSSSQVCSNCKSFLDRDYNASENIIVDV